ncbi:hypothetical protein ACP70R_024185 [Stipagrostis hirtigluma subsp. patula]
MQPQDPLPPPIVPRRSRRGRCPMAQAVVLQSVLLRPLRRGRSIFLGPSEYDASQLAAGEGSIAGDGGARGAVDACARGPVQETSASDWSQNPYDEEDTEVQDAAAPCCPSVLFNLEQLIF